MESARSVIKEGLAARLAEPSSWLLGPGARGFAAAVAIVEENLRRDKRHQPVVVAEVKSASYLAAVLTAVKNRRPVVLANPEWGEVGRAQAAAQIKPGVWLGAKGARWPGKTPAMTFNAAQWAGGILIPTGGTGGRVRWAVHRWATLAAAARALVEFLNVEGCVHVSTLPVWHVSGLMPAVRALETGGILWLDDWKKIAGGRPPSTPPECAVISLVPTQLLRLLEQRAVVNWLRKTRAILLGGAAPLPGLLERARELRLPVALAYGMTETAAVVAMQKPDDFLAGSSPAVAALPHAKIWVGDEWTKSLRAGTAGRIWVRADSLFAGYYPAVRKGGAWATGDAGMMASPGQLRVLGRLDRVIISGGEKVDPAEVERQILATGLVKQVRVMGLPDAEWGERVMAVYWGGTGRIGPIGRMQLEQKLGTALRRRLAPAAVPKTWLRAKSISDFKFQISKTGI